MNSLNDISMVGARNNGRSEDNRTAGFRVVGSDSSLSGVESPGATDPYLALAASASGLDGVANK